MVATRSSETDQNGTDPRSKNKEENPKLRSLAQGVTRHPTKSENAQSLPQKRNDNAVRNRLDAVIGDQSVASKGDHTTAPSIPPGTSRRHHGTQSPSMPVPYSGRGLIHASESWSHRFRRTRVVPNRTSMIDLETNLSAAFGWDCGSFICCNTAVAAGLCDTQKFWQMPCSPKMRRHR